MKTKTSKKSIVFRSLLLLPLLALLLYGFSDKIVVPLYEEPVSEETFVDFQEGATTEQIEEYNVLARKYNRQISNDKAIQIFKSDVERLEYLHGLMTNDQKENADPFPDFPEPPKAPKVHKGEKSNIPPPPPSPPDHKEVVHAEKIIKDIIENQDPYDGKIIYLNKKGRILNVLKGEEYIEIENRMTPPRPPSTPIWIQEVRSKLAPNAPVVKVGEVSDIPPPPPPTAPIVRKGELSTIPPPPPKSPMDHVVDMAKKDATFYLEGKEISSDKAIAILKKNKKINIRTRHEGLKKPIVELSTKPIVIKK